MFQKFKSSGYLKTMVICVIMLAVTGGAVVGMEFYDRWKAGPPAEETQEGGPAPGRMVTGRATEGEGMTDSITIGGAVSDAPAEGVILQPVEDATILPAEGQTITATGDGETRQFTAVGQDGEGGVMIAPDGESAPAGGGRVMRGAQTKEDMAAALAQAVETGRMTQEQADEILEQFKNGETVGRSMPVRPSDGEGAAPAESTENAGD